jgi:ankyrin repeat protein
MAESGHQFGSPIQVAARLGHLEVVEFLIAAKADVDAGTLFSTPLLDAIATHHFEIALKLIDAGADPTLTAEFDCIPPIAWAAIAGSQSVIRALVKAGADPDEIVPRMTVETETVMDSSPLILAARWGHATVVTELLEMKVACDHRDGMGLTAYDWAVRNQHSQIIALLSNSSARSILS